MKIHFYTKGDERIGDSRQRAMYVADELRGRGIDAVVHWPPVVQISTTRWPKKFFLIVATIRSLFSVKKGDIVFLQRTIGKKFFFVFGGGSPQFFPQKYFFDLGGRFFKAFFLKKKNLFAAE